MERSILKPPSPVALSVHLRSMRLEEIGVATRFVGAPGSGFVVAEATFE
jgi:hypothetical protein